MSKDRAVRRAAREAERDRRGAERVRQEAAEASRHKRRQRWVGWLPRRTATTRWSRATGLLADKRRRAFGLLVAGFLVVQLLTWIATPSWGLRAAVFLVSLFALPVVAVLTSS